MGKEKCLSEIVCGTEVVILLLLVWKDMEGSLAKTLCIVLCAKGMMINVKSKIFFTNCLSWWVTIMKSNYKMRPQIANYSWNMSSTHKWNSSQHYCNGKSSISLWKCEEIIYKIAENIHLNSTQNIPSWWLTMEGN